MEADGDYRRVQPENRETAFAAHQYFMDNPSLSGRGSALEVSLPPRLSHKGGKSA